MLNKEKRFPLVLIDDLDKLDLELARNIFFDRHEIMARPTYPIVYTVSSSLFYSHHVKDGRMIRRFLPNIKLHDEGRPDGRDHEGALALKNCIHRRMIPELISEEAAEAAIAASGGVFRELARIMRGGTDRAIANGRKRVEADDVALSVAELRGEYRRLLTADQRASMKQIHRTNQLDDPKAVAPLLQMLAVLEYANGEPWFDVHPALLPMLK